MNEVQNTIFRFYACFQKYYYLQYIITYDKLWEWYISDHVPEIGEKLMAQDFFNNGVGIYVEGFEPNEKRVKEKYGRVLTKEEFFEELDKRGEQLVNFASFSYEIKDDYLYYWDLIPHQGFIRKNPKWDKQEYEEYLKSLKNPYNKTTLKILETANKKPEIVTEKQLEDYLASECRKLSWKCEKQNPKIFGRGVPDRKITKPDGTVIYVELKTPQKNGNLSHYQIEFHEKLRNQGYEVKVIWSKEQVDKLLNTER